MVVCFSGAGGARPSPGGGVYPSAVVGPNGVTARRRFGSPEVVPLPPHGGPVFSARRWVWPGRCRGSGEPGLEEGEVATFGDYPAFLVGLPVSAQGFDLVFIGEGDLECGIGGGDARVG